MVIPWLLSFPGVFAPRGLLGGSSSEITVWLYTLWHAGFPMFVIAYALLKDAQPAMQLRRFSAGSAILSCIVVTAAVISAATYLLIALQAHLPSFMIDAVNFSGLWYDTAAIIALLSALAIILLWIRRKSLLDLWLMVVMLVFLTEVLISSFPVSARFTLGWYAGRSCSLLSGSLILFVLLYEITIVYASPDWCRPRPESRARRASDHWRCGGSYDRSRDQTATCCNYYQGRDGPALA
jgi:hypothetical protein